MPLLKNNPLPPVIDITLTQFNNATQSLKDLMLSVQTSTIVDETKLDTQWLQRMDFILTIAKRIILTLALLLSAGVILVVSNTIRLMTQTHKSEMQILKFIGATNHYIRRPFLYHGLLYGCLGGAVAWLLVYLVFDWISQPILQLIQSYGAALQIQGTDLITGAYILGAATLLSLIGSWLAIQQYLNEQAP